MKTFLNSMIGMFTELNSVFVLHSKAHYNLLLAYTQMICLAWAIRELYALMYQVEWARNSFGRAKDFYSVRPIHQPRTDLTKNNHQTLYNAQISTKAPISGVQSLPVTTPSHQ